MVRVMVRFDNNGPRPAEYQAPSAVSTAQQFMHGAHTVLAPVSCTKQLHGGVPGASWVCTTIWSSKGCVPCPASCRLHMFIGEHAGCCCSNCCCPVRSHGNINSLLWVCTRLCACGASCCTASCGVMIHRTVKRAWGMMMCSQKAALAWQRSNVMKTSQHDVPKQMVQGVPHITSRHITSCHVMSRHITMTSSSSSPRRIVQPPLQQQSTSTGKASCSSGVQ